MYLLSTEEGVLYFVPNIFAFITGQKYQKICGNEKSLLLL